MNEKPPLDELLAKYVSGALGRKEFEGRIFQHILDNYRRFHLYRWTREQCGDFLSWLYPRLSRAIDLYRDQGASFDAYIGSLVYWSAREYRTKLANHSMVEYACWKAKAEDMAVHSCEPEYMPVRSAPEAATPRQILMLILKSYHFVSDDFLARIAPAVGMDLEEIGLLIEALRGQRIKREEEIRGLQERIHCQYYRCLCFERRLISAPAGSAVYEKLEGCLIRAKTRLASMKKRLAGIRLDATNRQVAELLGIPKGTVDSSLRSLKMKWKDQAPFNEDDGEI